MSYRDLYNDGSGEQTPLGTGWTHTFNQYLKLLDPHTEDSDGGTVYSHPNALGVAWIMDDGTQVLFPETGTDIFGSPAGRAETVTLSGLDYTIVTADGMRLTFEAADSSSDIAKLVEIAAGSDDVYAVQLEYYASGNSDECASSETYASDGALCKVTSTNGRTLYFRYSSGKLASVAAPGVSDVLVDYYYDASSCGVTSGDCDGSTLCCTRQHGTSSGMNYHYDFTSGGLTRLKQVETTTDGDGGVAIVEKHTWSGTDGGSPWRVDSSESVDEKLTLSYDTCGLTTGWDGGTITDVVDSARGSGSGAEHCYRFQNDVVTDIAGNCGCGEESFGWDSTGYQLQSSTDKLGHQRTVSFDWKNRWTGVTESDDDGDGTNDPPSTGTKSWYTYAGDTNLVATLQRSPVHGSTKSEIEYDRTVDGGTVENPLVNTVIRTGQTSTDEAAMWSDSSTGWGSQTQTTSIDWTLTTGALTERVSTGPGTNEKVDEVFYPSDTSVPNAAGRLEHLRRYTDATTYLTTSFGDSACSTSGFDVYGHPMTVTDETGVVHCFTYDSQGRLTNERLSTQSSGAGTRYTYTVDGQVETVVDDSGAMTKYVYGGGMVGAVSANLLMAVERWSASSGGTLISRTEKTYFTTDLNRNLLSKEVEVARSPKEGAPCSSSTDCASDASLTCSAGTCQIASCTGTGNSTCSSGGTSVCEDDSCYQVQRVTEYGYDDERRLSQVKIHRTDPSSVDAIQKTVMDDLGNTTEEETTNGSGSSVSDDETYVLDELNRVKEVDKEVGGSSKKMETLTYDARGNPATTTYYTASGTQYSQTTYQYDDFDRLLYVDSPDRGKVAYEYDAAGNLSAGKDGVGNVIARDYDALGRLLEIDYPTETDTMFHYDEASTPSLTDCRTGAAISWPPDRHGAGRLTSVVDSSSHHYFNYDEFGRESSRFEVRDVAGETCARVTEWTYDDAGRVTSVRYPTGRLFHYHYAGTDPTAVSSIDADLTDATDGGTVDGGTVDLATDMRFGANGEPRHLALSNGLTADYDWFLDGSPKSHVYTNWSADGGTVVYQRTATSVDTMGNPTHVAGISGNDSETYAYQPDFHYLTQAQDDDYLDGGYPPDAGMPYGEEDYAYGPDGGTSGPDMTLLGDRTLRTANYGGSAITHDETISASSSQLQDDTITQPDGTEERLSFGYDGMGRADEIDDYVLDGGTWIENQSNSVPYDEADHLSTPDAGYDYRDLMTQYQSPAIPAAVSEFYHGDDGTLLAETGCDDSMCEQPIIAQDYLYLGDQPIAMMKSRFPSMGDEDDTAGHVYAIETGLLGEPRRVADANRTVQWALDIPPYGRDQTVQPSPDNVAMNLGFPGQYWFDEMGMDYNWHRWYMPWTGRYIQADPLLTQSIGHDSADLQGLSFFPMVERSEVGAPLDKSLVRALFRVRFGQSPMQGYAYTGGLPLSYTDPTGYCIEDLCIGEGIAVAAVAAWAAASIAAWTQAHPLHICKSDDDDHCDEQYETDVRVCRAIGKRSKRRGALCWASAMERKVACTAGLPIPPLQGWWN